MVSKEILQKKIELVVNRLMNLECPEYDENLTASQQLAKGLVKRDFGIREWDWPQGIGLYGLLQLNEYKNDGAYDDFFADWYESNIELGLPSKNVNTTAPFLPLVHLMTKLNKPEYETMCIKQAEWLMKGLPRTKDGGFQHVTSAVGDRDGVRLNDGELWIDTLVMTVLFLNKMGLVLKNQEWIDEAVHQILVHIKYLFDKQTGLFHHGWTFQENSNFGSVFWCRGNSWFTFGITDYLETWEQNSTYSLNKGFREFLIDTLQAQTKALIPLQTPAGLFRTVLTDSGSYEEVSGTAGIAAGILKGIKLGILSTDYLKYAESAIQGICDNIDENGIVLNVSSGTGVGYNAQHYNNIITAPMAYGQALALIALTEALTF